MNPMILRALRFILWLLGAAAVAWGAFAVLLGTCLMWPRVRRSGAYTGYKDYLRFVTRTLVGPLYASQTVTVEPIKNDKYMTR